MRKLVLTTALGAACLSLAACGDRDANRADENAAVADTESMDTEGADVNSTGSAGGSAFSSGSRIVEENGITYRIDADGTRTRLGENDSRIVVENGTRYRVDPDGARVRIGNDGASIDIDTPDVDLPDVDVGINKKGNPDVDVKSKGDGDSGPN